MLFIAACRNEMRMLDETTRRQQKVFLGCASQYYQEWGILAVILAPSD